MTPNGVDLFSRYMAEEFDESEVIAVSTLFQSIFVGPMSRTYFSPDSNVADLDILRGNERIAALIPRGSVSRTLGANQKNMQQQKYSSFSRKFPLAEEEGAITGAQILNRTAGENPYDAMTRQSRMRKLGARLHFESIRRIVRMNEVLAAQAALTGKQDAIIGAEADGDTDLVYDYLRDSSLTVTPSNTWNSGSQDILGDIDGMCDAIRAKGRTQPNAMLLGGEAMAAFIADTDVQSNADNRRFDLIQVSLNNPVPAKYQRLVDAGANARGMLRTPKGYELWMFTYVDGYDNSAGTFTKYMPDDQALIFSADARTDRHFGPPETLPMVNSRIQLYQEYFGINPMAAPMPPMIKNQGAVVDPGQFWCDAYISSDAKKINIRTQEAPIFVTTQTDAFGLLQNLIT